MNKYVNSEIIKAFIEKNNLSKTQFCQRCHISVQTLNKVLRKEGDCFIGTIFKIVKAMEIKISQIIIKNDKKTQIRVKIVGFE